MASVTVLSSVGLRWEWDLKGRDGTHRFEGKNYPARGWVVRLLLLNRSCTATGDSASSNSEDTAEDVLDCGKHALEDPCDEHNKAGDNARCSVRDLLDVLRDRNFDRFHSVALLRCFLRIVSCAPHLRRRTSRMMRRFSST